ncbi:MAG: hypothetical protein O7D30_08770 [Rickettsia endosymbiont of Ixodes persulcatus]|nr:hypothetical protein [Rickettsia endosymbiont of Ixodes persulcatus]
MGTEGIQVFIHETLNIIRTNRTKKITLKCLQTSGGAEQTTLLEKRVKALKNVGCKHAGKISSQNAQATKAGKKKRNCAWQFTGKFFYCLRR